MEKELKEHLESILQKHEKIQFEVIPLGKDCTVSSIYSNFITIFFTTQANVLLKLVKLLSLLILHLLYQKLPIPQ